MNEALSTTIGGEDKRCGEIYLTIEGFMLFYCTLCEEKFNGFEEYARHVEIDHKSIFCPFDVTTESYEVTEDCNNEIYQHLICTTSNDEIINVKTENEPLYETKFSVNKLKKKTKSRKKAKHIVSAFSDNNETDAAVEVQKNKDTKHIDVRPIRKKTNYFQSDNDIRPFLCDLCDAKFKDPSTLSKHRARHTTEKTYPCPKCPKKFYTLFDVKKHQRSHTAERPFLCSICGKTLLSNEKLKDHMRRHTDQRDYECPVCKKRFYNSNLLSSHKLVHNKEKSFHCTFCNAKFTFRKGLQNHLKLHENKREYKCDLCEADFNQQAGLFCHKKTKHQIATTNLISQDFSK